MQSLLLSGASLAETSLSCRGLRLCLLPGWSGTLLIFLFLVPLGSSLYLDFFIYLFFGGFSIYSKTYVFYLSNISKRHVSGDVHTYDFRNL